uniref:Uncharacterized protein n=1 Tax=Cacopsylla melanoneura TaxID=428564 RepID=A0A8D9BYM4_9HEMI
MLIAAFVNAVHPCVQKVLIPECHRKMHLHQPIGLSIIPSLFTGRGLSNSQVILLAPLGSNFNQNTLFEFLFGAQCSQIVDGKLKQRVPVVALEELVIIESFKPFIFILFLNFVEEDMISLVHLGQPPVEILLVP